MPNVISLTPNARPIRIVRMVVHAFLRFAIAHRGSVGHTARKVHVVRNKTAMVVGQETLVTMGFVTVLFLSLAPTVRTIPSRARAMMIAATMGNVIQISSVSATRASRA